ncbi:hypothetical protein [Cohnella zeiphila]|uniref:Uncharacterized protein n=1 Tax=Cohnella zeiphila TaxID=2761120 RepID=A0A7X0SRS3_9BACL|nr:hypothetical protein [Cohnella zeiphila]MBB6732678.1 hypothetical protein [Cohnella zeiphila]
MKIKSSFILVIMVMLFLASSGSVLAATNTSPKGKVLFKADQITDIDSIIERAKKGINDSNLVDKTTETSDIVLNSDDGKHAVNAKVTKYRTSQLLERRLTPENSVVETYAVMDVSTTITRGDEAWDPSIAVRAYSTIYVERTVVNTREYWRLTSVTGGWANSDNGIAVTNRLVRIGTTGFAGSIPVAQHQEFNPSSNTFSYAAPTTWKPIDAAKTGNMATDPVVGAYTECKLTGYGDSWTLTLSNNL